MPILLACVVGALVGLFNGFAVAYGGIPSFIVTLGSMTMVRGLALITSGGSPISGVAKEFEQIAGLVGSVPLLAIYYVAIIAVAAFVLNKTVFGRHVYAVGGNEIAAQVTGVRVRGVKLAVFAIAGLLAAQCLPVECPPGRSSEHRALVSATNSMLSLPWSSAG